MARRVVALSLDAYDHRIQEGAARYFRASAEKIHLMRTLVMPWQRVFPHSILHGAIVLVRLQEHSPLLRAALKKIQYPVVTLGAGACPQVLEDNYAAGQLAAEYYLQRKFRRFAVFRHACIP